MQKNVKLLQITQNKKKKLEIVANYDRLRRDGTEYITEEYRIRSYRLQI